MSWDESSPVENYYNNFPIVLDEIDECSGGQSQRQDFAQLSQLMASPCPEQPLNSGSSPSTTHQDLLEKALEPQESSDSSKTGRFSAKAMLLTYSQCPQLTRELILEHLRSLDNSNSQLLGAIIGQEEHQDKGIHFHAAAHWTASRTWRPKIFDVMGVHPNCQTHKKGKSTYAESLMRMWKYPQKEDTTPLMWGVPPAMKRTRKDTAMEAIAIAKTRSVPEAILFLETEDPVELVRNYAGVERNLTLMRQAATKTHHPARSLEDFKVGVRLAIPEELKSLYIWGKSGAGKTQLARAILPEASLVRHVDQLKNCDFSKGIIFDDFALSHWPVTSVIHLLDWEEASGIHVRYSHVIIPPYTKKIFTYNDCIEYWMPSTASPEQQIAVKRRVVQLELTSKCFI